MPVPSHSTYLKIGASLQSSSLKPKPPPVTPYSNMLLLLLLLLVLVMFTCVCECVNTAIVRSDLLCLGDVLLSLLLSQLSPHHLFPEWHHRFGHINANTKQQAEKISTKRAHTMFAYTTRNKQDAHASCTYKTRIQDAHTRCAWKVRTHDAYKRYTCMTRIKGTHT